MPSITDSQWQQYQQQGYLKLDWRLSEHELGGLQERINQIMLGEAPIDYGQMLMQLDSQTGRYEDAGPQSRGHKGPTLNYRKIQDLELDPLFLNYMRRPAFRDACQRVYGRSVEIACFRAMFMNKPAGRGTILPWHQDRWTDLDRDPLLTVWTALDPATVANGCVEVVPGSHRHGLINPTHPSGFLNEGHIREHCGPGRSVFIELAAGEVVLLHNWLVHRSDVNKTDFPRRAFSVCYMPADTRSHSGDRFSLIFGQQTVLEPVA